MTYAEREEIFSKEALDVNDMMKLYGISVNSASALMVKIRTKVGDRLGIKGKVHVQDYLDYFSLTPERYGARVDVDNGEKPIER